MLDITKTEFAYETEDECSFPTQEKALEWVKNSHSIKEGCLCGYADIEDCPHQEDIPDGKDLIPEKDKGVL